MMDATAGPPPRHRRIRGALPAVVGLLVCGCLAVGLLVGCSGLRPAELLAMSRVLWHHAAEMERLCARRRLPPAYFEALVVLESRGRADPGRRFEPAVYDRLRRVRDGELPAMEGVLPGQVADATDDALRNLATSWGPLQVMGYHCIEVGVLVRDLREEEALRWSITWVDRAYGDLLRAGRFRDAFHVHNAGRPFPADGRPRTHDPDYVERGLRLMRAFRRIHRLRARLPWGSRPPERTPEG